MHQHLLLLGLRLGVRRQCFHTLLNGQENVCPHKKKMLLDILPTRVGSRFKLRVSKSSLKITTFHNCLYARTIAVFHGLKAQFQENCRQILDHLIFSCNFLQFKKHQYDFIERNLTLPDLTYSYSWIDGFSQRQTQSASTQHRTVTEPVEVVGASSFSCVNTWKASVL